MKIEDIITLYDLQVFLTDYQKENPNDDCCELIREICKKNVWVYTADSDGIVYDDEDFVTDGEHILSLVSTGWQLFENNGQDIFHKGNYITVRENGYNYYVNFNTGLGEGIYPKSDWTIFRAIMDQENICKENQ